MGPLWARPAGPLAARAQPSQTRGVGSPRLALLLGLALAAAACGARPQPAAPTAAPPLTSTPQARASPALTPTHRPTATPAPTQTVTPTVTPTLTSTPAPTATATPHPLGWATVPALRQRAYGGSGVEVLDVLGSGQGFIRYLIAFPSDGLTVRGFMNVPQGEGPFPVVITVHGYVNPATYQTLSYTTSYADAYASAGFLVLHPDLRGHGRSEPGPNAFRSGYAIDVLNLIHQLDSIPQADPERVGLWGHSMGGGITIKVLTVTDRVDAAVVYGSMSADEAANHQRILFFSGGQAAGSESLPVSPHEDPALYGALSPVNFLDALRIPVQIHHGEEDAQVPVEWSKDLAGRLPGAELFLYPGQGHSLQGEARALLDRRVIEFFRRVLSPTG